MIDLIKRDLKTLYLKTLYNKSWAKNINHITVIEFIVYIIFLFKMSNSLLFFNMVGIDSTIAAAIFVNAMFKHNNNIRKEYKNEQKLNTELYKTYYSNYESIRHLFDFEASTNVYRKYFLFGICQLISTMVTLIFNGYFTSVINGLLMFLAIPFFTIGILLLKKFCIIYNRIAKTVRRFIRYIVSKITAKAINTISRACLKVNPNIDHNEMYKFYDNSDTSFGNSILFVKTAVITSYIHYIKKSDNIIYSNIVNFIQKYQMNDIFKVPTFKNSVQQTNVDYLKDVIRRRKWNEFLEPKTFHLILDMYGTNGDDSIADKIEQIYDIIIINSIRFSSLWTLSSIHPVIAILIDAYFTQNVKQLIINHYVIPYCIAALITCFVPMVGAFLIVTSDIIMKSIIDYFIEHILTHFVARSIRRPEKFKYILMSPLIMIGKWLSLTLPSLVYFTEYRNPYMIGTSIIVAISTLSNFGPLHQLILWLTYILIFDIWEEYIQNSEEIEQKSEQELEQEQKEQGQKEEPIKEKVNISKEETLLIENYDKIKKQLSNISTQRLININIIDDYEADEPTKFKQLLGKF